jgi:hypothetical protein
MTALLVLTFVLLVGPLALRYGVDSTIYEDRPRHW